MASTSETVWAVEVGNTVRKGGLPRDVALKMARELVADGESGVSIAEYTMDEGSSAISRESVNAGDQWAEMIADADDVTKLHGEPAIVIERNPAGGVVTFLRGDDDGRVWYCSEGQRNILPPSMTLAAVIAADA